MTVAIVKPEPVRALPILVAKISFVNQWEIRCDHAGRFWLHVCERPNVLDLDYFDRLPLEGIKTLEEAIVAVLVLLRDAHAGTLEKIMDQIAQEMIATGTELPANPRKVST